MITRRASDTDLQAIQRIVEMAFSEDENTLIKELAAGLLTQTTPPPILSYVAEEDGELVGYVSFSPVFFGAQSKISGYILAPLAVSPKHQKKGVGAKLVEEGIDALTRQRVDVLLVYGDPKYYERFGFKQETTRLFKPPHQLEYPFGWLGLFLSEQVDLGADVQCQCVKPLDKPDLW